MYNLRGRHKLKLTCLHVKLALPANVRNKEMRIAACDDDLNFLQGLSELLNKYSEEKHCHIEYKVFTNPLELVLQMEKGIHYDLILLDVCMPGMNGIQCAKDIRVYDNFVKIVFLTTSTEYAVDSYSVKAHDYLLKPIEKEKLFSILRQMERESKMQEQNIFVLRSKMGMVKISISKLEYCEVINRKVVFHLLNDEEFECGLRMNELEEKLKPFGCFLRPHRSFLVNMDYIRTLTTHNIITENGANIPVPREKYPQIKEAYMEYVFNAKDSIIIGN